MIDVDTDSGENLYAVLGVTENATDVEIKTAYRQLAKRFHPDSGRPGDAERFRRVREAYETLSDPERRRAYDGGGSSSAAFPVSWTSGFAEPLVPVGGFREVFARREPKIHLDIVLSHDEAERGARAVLEVPRDAPCHVCGGAGSDFLGCCAHCRGAGFLRDYERLVFTIPPAAEQGDYVAARTRDGQTVRARVSIRGGR